METIIGYDAINKGDEPLIVSSKTRNKVVGTICPNEKFSVLDSWISKDNKYINAKIKFINYNGDITYGYLYDISYVKQVSF